MWDTFSSTLFLHIVFLIPGLNQCKVYHICNSYEIMMGQLKNKHTSLKLFETAKYLLNCKY